jgi:hypothetical protein
MTAIIKGGTMSAVAIDARSVMILCHSISSNAVNASYRLAIGAGGTGSDSPFAILVSKKIET